LEVFAKIIIFNDLLAKYATFFYPFSPFEGRFICCETLVNKREIFYEDTWIKN
jgi:hypothetical protein